MFPKEEGYQNGTDTYRLRRVSNAADSSARSVRRPHCLGLCLPAKADRPFGPEARRKSANLGNWHVRPTAVFPRIIACRGRIPWQNHCRLSALNVMWLGSIDLPPDQDTLPTNLVYELALLFGHSRLILCKNLSCPKNSNTFGIASELLVSILKKLVVFGALSQETAP